MTVSFKLMMGMTLFHAQTMKELRIDKVIEQSYNEDSQEYKELCNSSGWVRHSIQQKVKQTRKEEQKKWEKSN